MLYCARDSTGYEDNKPRKGDVRPKISWRFSEACDTKDYWRPEMRGPLLNPKYYEPSFGDPSQSQEAQKVA